MADSTIVDRASQAIQAEIAGALRGHCQTLPQPEHADAFGTFFDRFGDARIVLLGEATHGSSDFYKARAAITRHLIHHHGFSFVAAEADWPDAARIDRYVRHREPEPSRSEAFARFPTWMWHNTDVMALVDWLRGHNQNLPPDRRVSFHGLDLYSLGMSIDAVLAYLDRVDPEAAKIARRRYGCLTPWQAEPADYGRAVHRGNRASRGAPARP